MGQAELDLGDALVDRRPVVIVVVPVIIIVVAAGTGREPGVQGGLGAVRVGQRVESPEGGEAPLAPAREPLA